MTEKLALNKLSDNIKLVVNEAKKNPEIEILKVFLSKANDDSVRQIVPSRIEVLLRKLFISRSNSYGLTDVVHDLETSLFSKISTSLKISVVFYDKYDVSLIEVDDLAYKTQVNFWSMLDSSKPDFPLCGKVSTINDRTRTGSLKEVSTIEVIEIVEF